jgi:hypothetical protein
MPCDVSYGQEQDFVINTIFVSLIPVLLLGANVHFYFQQVQHFSKWSRSRRLKGVGFFLFLIIDPTEKKI